MGVYAHPLPPMPPISGGSAALAPSTFFFPILRRINVRMVHVAPLRVSVRNVKKRCRASARPDQQHAPHVAGARQRPVRRLFAKCANRLQRRQVNSTPPDGAGARQDRGRILSRCCVRQNAKQINPDRPIKPGRICWF